MECTLFYWPFCIVLSFAGLSVLNSLLLYCTLFHWPLCIVPLFQWHLCIVLSFTGISVLYSLLLASLYCTLFSWHLCIALSLLASLYCTLFYWYLCIVLSFSGLSPSGKQGPINRGQLREADYFSIAGNVSGPDMFWLFLGLDLSQGRTCLDMS